MRNEDLKAITFYVTLAEFEKLKSLANVQGLTLSAEIRLLLNLPFLERGAPTGNKNRQRKDMEEEQMYDGLTFEKDIRHQDPELDNRRKSRFSIGWKEAVAGQIYKEEALKELTWQNTGYRIGKVLGEASSELIEEMYKLCVKIQAEQPKR